MSDLIELRQGAHPWQPTPDTELVHVLDEYNIPLAGVVSQGGAPYLFVCHGGEDEDVNVWLYAPIDNSEYDMLVSKVGRELLPAMADCLRNRRVVAAFAAMAELELWDWFDAGDEDPVVTVHRFLKRAQRRLAMARRGVDRLERQAGQEDAQSELAFA